MQNYPHRLRAVSVAHDFTDFSRDSTVTDGKPADASANLYSIDQYDGTDDDQTILWGDLFIDMRHLQRLAQATA